jgi:acetoin utilization deacetylase AcuC-like enzyme
MDSHPVAFVSGPEYLEHYAGLGHPESPERLAAIWERLADDGLWDRLEHVEPRPAEPGELELVHRPDYIELVRRETTAGRAMLSTGDASICPKSHEVALLAAGGCLAAVEAVCGGRARSAFCAVRPPGHHATPSAGMGFCLFNNAAVAARHAQRACGVERVLIVDWDVHHGNGTQAAFYDDPSVLYFSTHQRGHYPESLTGLGHPGQTGDGPAAGTTVNRPLPRHAGDAGMLEAFREGLLPAAADFAPELVIVSSGFDCMLGDPLGGLDLTESGLAELTRMVMAVSDESAGGRIVSILEGGYSLRTLAAAVATHIRTLMGES